MSNPLGTEKVSDTELLERVRECYDAGQTLSGGGVVAETVAADLSIVPDTAKDRLRNLTEKGALERDWGFCDSGHRLGYRPVQDRTVNLRDSETRDDDNVHASRTEAQLAEANPDTLAEIDGDGDREVRTDGGHVGPIVFANETARNQLLEGEVITFRKSERTTGDTWWRKSRTGPKEGDARVEHIGAVDPRDDDALEPYRELSGFVTVDDWRAAMAELNGEVPDKGHLYRVTLAEQTLATDGGLERFGVDCPEPEAPTDEHDERIATDTSDNYRYTRPQCRALIGAGDRCLNPIERGGSDEFCPRHADADVETIDDHLEADGGTVQTPDRLRWTPDAETSDQTECQNCGSKVSRQFARVFGDNDDVPHACPECAILRTMDREASNAGGVRR